MSQQCCNEDTVSRACSSFRAFPKNLSTEWIKNSKNYSFLKKTTENNSSFICFFQFSVFIQPTYLYYSHLIRFSFLLCLYFLLHLFRCDLFSIPTRISFGNNFSFFYISTPPQIATLSHFLFIPSSPPCSQRFLISLLLRSVTASVDFAKISPSLWHTQKNRKAEKTLCMYDHIIM